jgi:hypothetical protein
VHHCWPHADPCDASVLIQVYAGAVLATAQFSSTQAEGTGHHMGAYPSRGCVHISRGTTQSPRSEWWGLAVMAETDWPLYFKGLYSLLIVRREAGLVLR